MPLTDNHILAIGRIVVAFNELEESAEFTLQVLMGGAPNVVWQVLTVGEPFDRLIFRIAMLTRLRLPYPDLLEDLEAWMREAKKVQDDRNRIVHTGWTYFPDTEDDVAVSLKMTSKKPFGDLRDYAPGDLHAIADRIGEVADALDVLRRRMHDLPMRMS
jgi:hypothetical protein